MTELLPVFIICMVGAILTDMFSLYDHEEKKYVYRDKFFFIIITIAAAVFCGLRLGYNDTFSYRHLYELVDTSQPFFSDLSWKLSESVGFKMAYKAMAYLGWDVQLFLMAFALVDVGVVFWFVFRHSESITLSVFLLFATSVYTFCFAAIMQCTATAFSLIGVDLYLRKHPLGFLFFVLLGAVFHTYGLIYLIVPFLVGTPWNERTYYIIIGTVAVSILFTEFVRLVIGIISATGETFTEGDFYSGGISLFRLLVTMVTPVLSYFCREELGRSDDKLLKLSVNICIVQACIMFLGLFGTANYFARMANYFLVFQCIALPGLIERYFDSHKPELLSVKNAMIVGYAGYFYYAEAVANGGFDVNFSAMTLRGFIAIFER